MKNAKNLMNEFKSFILKGNIIDMAVGVIIGGAFSKIVTSLVNDIFMPALSVLTGGINFSDLKWVINSAIYDSAGEMINEEVAVLYGAFVQNIIDFLLVGICMFFVIKAVVKVNETFHKKEEEKPEEQPKGPSSEELLTEIRDLLRNKD